MAGRGAPEVSQCRMTDMPSITALSAGPAVMLGAIPEEEEGEGGGQPHAHKVVHNTQKHAHAHMKSGETEVIMRDINSSLTNKADGS